MIRPYQTSFPSDFLRDYQTGVMAYRYKGKPCLKSPIDLAIYLQVLWNERPRTIFEIGSGAGGSAVFFSDVAASYDLKAEIVSIDREPPGAPGAGNIRFLSGDVLDLETVFARNDLFSLPHPWFVIEDSAHTYAGCAAALRFFGQHLCSGELLVMEDGILDDLGMSETYQGGPNRAIAEIGEQSPELFEVVTNYANMFGRNATYNPNGYLRRK